MQCAEAVRLERQLKQCQSAYEGLQRQLERGMGTLPRRQYFALSSQVDQAGEMAQQARSVLDAHVRQHSCKVKGASR